MARYRKLPVEIEAVQIGGDESVLMFTETYAGKRQIQCGYDADCHYILISTPEGVMRAEDGDWIIKDVAGEIYSCKDEIFQQTYEPYPPRETFLSRGIVSNKKNTDI